MKIIPVILAVIFTSFSLCGEVSINATFEPKGVPATAKRAELTLAPSNMSFVKCELNGRPCVMLFDTGATHTTFDINFVKREFPDTPMQQVVDSGDTNVGQNPFVFQVGTLKVGEAEFADFSAMAIDLSGLGPMSGGTLAGVLGMNVIGASRTLVSLAKSEILFGLGEDAREGFERPARRMNDRFDFTILLATDCGKGTMPLIIDTGSTWTFLQRDCGWPATTNEVAFMARDINGAAGMKPVVGEKGVLKLHPKAEIEITPLLVHEPLNRIGSDTLRKYDLLIEPRAVAFRKVKKNETQAE